MDDKAVMDALVDAINLMPQTIDAQPLRLFSSGPTMTEGFRRVFPGMIIVEQAEVGGPCVIHHPKAA